MERASESADAVERIEQLLGAMDYTYVEDVFKLISVTIDRKERSLKGGKMAFLMPESRVSKSIVIV